MHIANRDEGQYGVGWSMIDDARLAVQDGLPGQPDGVALVTGVNDVTWFHNPTSEGVYTRAGNPNNFSELQKDDNGTSEIESDDTYILTDPDGTVTTFDYQGLLQTVVDRNGNTLARYTYGTGGDWDKIVDIEDQAGRHTHFQYDSGLLVGVTDFYDGTAGAQTTQYDYYSGTDQLQRMIEPDPDGTGPLTSPVTTYHYNALGLLDKVTDPRGLGTTITYDQTRRVSSITERCGGVTNITSLQSLVTVAQTYQPNDPVPDEQDWAELYTWLPPDGTVTDSDIEAAFAGDTYETRDVFGNQTKIIRDRFGNVNYSQDANGTIRQYKRNYSSNGLINEIVEPDPNNPSGTLTTHYSYDASGRLTTVNHPILYPFGNQSWSFDEFGQLDNYIDDVHDVEYDLDQNGHARSMTQRNFLEELVTTYTYTDGTGTTSIKGLVETITDPNGNETHYTYNGQGLVETIVYAAGTGDEYTEEYAYDNRDRLQFFTDGRGGVTEYVYDNLDRLIQRIDPDPDDSGPLASPAWQFLYDPSGNRTHVIDPLGNDTETVYDQRDRPGARIQHNAAVLPPVAHWKLDETSGTTASDSSYSGKTGTVIGTANWVAGVHDNGFQFNGATKIQATGLMGNPQNVSVAAWANLTSADHKGSEIISLGDRFGLRLDDSVNGPSEFSGAFARVGSETVYVAVEQTFAGSGWHFFAATFDDANNLFQLYIDGQLAASETVTSSISYAGGGSTVIGRHGGGSTNYDFNGVIDDAAIYSYALTAAQVAELYESGPTTRFEYDCNGNLVKTIDPLNRTTEYVYDDLNRLTTRKDPDPDTGGITANSPVTQYTYNALSWLTSTTDPNGNATFYQYDAMGRRTKEASDALFTTQVTTFEYDLVGRVIGITDPNGNITEFVYDQVDRLTSESIEIDSQTLTRSYDYDGNGNLIQKTDRNGRVTEYEYDHLNRLKTETWYDGQTPVRTISYAYDENSNLLSVTDPSAPYEYQYDYLNRQTDASQEIAGLTPAIDFERGYDVASRSTSSAAAIGATDDYLNAYTYDALGRLTRLTQTGQAGGNAVGNKRVDFAYNAASQLTALARYASLSTVSPVAATEYDYDAAGRLTSIAHDTTAPGSAFAETHGYTYDGGNRLTSYANVFGGVDAAYDYDSTNQLTGVDYTGQNDETYDYDANGNRETANGQTYQTASNNRILSDGTFTYQYDNEGNVTRRAPIGGRTYTEYRWDHRNRLVQLVQGDEFAVTSVVDYEYDHLNQLVKRTVDFDGDTGSAAIDQTFYLVDQGQVALEFHQVGSGNLDADDLAHRYLWGPTVDQLFADEQVDWSDSDADGEVLWALTDHLGSVRDVVDSNGKLRIHRSFDGFGNIVDETHYNASGATVTSGQTGYVDEAFAYTGRYFDEDTGLQNNLNRWYDPAVGRWISEDPSGFPAGDANLYRYVGNEPTIYTDPLGLFSLSDYWFYLTHPSAMDRDLRRINKGAYVAIGVGAGGLAGISATAGAGAIGAGTIGSGIVGGAAGGGVGGAISGLPDQTSGPSAAAGACIGAVTGGVGGVISKCWPKTTPMPGVVPVETPPPSLLPPNGGVLPLPKPYPSGWVRPIPGGGMTGGVVTPPYFRPPGYVPPVTPRPVPPWLRPPLDFDRPWWPPIAGEG